MSDYFLRSNLNTSTEIKISETEEIVISPGLLEQIEVAWNELLSWRSEISENATLLRVVSAGEEEVTVVPDITYKHVVGARAKALAPYLALSALAVVKTIDEYVVLQPRDSGDWPESFECVGGFVRSASGFRMVEDFITERFVREIPFLTISSVTCVGHYNFTSIAECMYVYVIEVQETAKEVRELSLGVTEVVHQTEITAYLRSDKKLSLPLHHPSARILEVLGSEGLL